MTPFNMTPFEFLRYCNELSERYHLIYLDYMDNFDGDIEKFCRVHKEPRAVIQHIINTGRLIEMGTYTKN